MAEDGGKVIYSYLNTMAKHNGSDLIFSKGIPPAMRIDNMLKHLNTDKLDSNSIMNMIKVVASHEQVEELENNRELDFSFPWSDYRFRVNAFFQKESPAAVIRLIPTKIPKMDELGLPLSAQRFASMPRGLVLVTGPTGSGKSTSLASMISYINSTMSKHIITIEDPIEYLHEHSKCVIEQREVGSDTLSFSNALRSALRQNPDVVLVGELRDLETISLAITTAETGHLVFGTLHTNDAPQTVDRIIDVFPGGQQSQIRAQLSNSLIGVVSQLLLPKEGGGRVATFEVMVANTAIRSTIRSGKSEQLYTAIQTGSEFGMQTMEQSLVNLFAEGKISYSVMMEATSRESEIDAQLKNRGIDVSSMSSSRQKESRSGPQSSLTGLSHRVNHK